MTIHLDGHGVRALKRLCRTSESSMFDLRKYEYGPKVGYRYILTPEMRIKVFYLVRRLDRYPIPLQVLTSSYQVDNGALGEIEWSM